MKKVILTGVAMMAFAAASFAQNSATLNQVGTSQTSNQNQSGDKLTSVVTQGNSAIADNTGNQASTDQRANNNTTTVTQTTSQYNQALVFQNVGSGKGSGGAINEATIQQVGSGGTSLLANPNTTPVAGGSGAGNVARIGQEQEGNHASIQQDGTGGTAGANNSNYGRIDQFGSNNGTSVNDVYIHQNGTSHGNVASISEQSGAASAKIEQNGSDAVASRNNTAAINQSSSIAGANASIQQNAGAGATDGSEGTSANNTATINQTGGTGDAHIQRNNGSGWAGANTAQIDQSAGDHTANITQNNDSQRNLATITQDGSGTDNATINQSGFSGDGTAKIHQAGGGSGTNTAFIGMKNQTGAPSDVTINQNTASGASGKNNSATVYQGLDGNAANEVALGISSDNHALINQNGSDNLVNQYQVGVKNRSTIDQSGSNNVVAGTNSFRAPAFAAQLGSDNTLVVTQIGTVGNTAAVFQNGTGNSGTITQGSPMP